MSRRRKIGIWIASAVAALMVIIGGVIFYVVNAPIWERQAMTFDKLKPLVAAYSEKHDAMSYARHDFLQNHDFSDPSVTDFYYERSEEYIHITSKLPEAELSGERYVLKSRQLSIRKYGTGAVEARTTKGQEEADKQDGGHDYDGTVKLYSYLTTGIIDLFSKPALHYKDGKYYLMETRTVKELFMHFEQSIFADAIYGNDSRAATIEAVVDAKTNALVSYAVRIAPNDKRPASYGEQYAQSIEMKNIGYTPANIKLKPDFQAVLAKQ